MATILQRFEHLGLAHNNKILMIVGVHISKKYLDQFGNQIETRRKLIQQKEGEEIFDVWDYPESWLKEMDRQILLYLEHYLDLKVDVRNG